MTNTLLLLHPLYHPLLLLQLYLLLFYLLHEYRLSAFLKKGYEHAHNEKNEVEIFENIEFVNGLKKRKGNDDLIENQLSRQKSKVLRRVLHVEND